MKTSGSGAAVADKGDQELAEQIWREGAMATTLNCQAPGEVILSPGTNCWRLVLCGGVADNGFKKLPKPEVFSAMM